MGGARVGSFCAHNWVGRVAGVAGSPTRAQWPLTSKVSANPGEISDPPPATPIDLGLMAQIFVKCPPPPEDVTGSGFKKLNTFILKIYTYLTFILATRYPSAGPQQE